MDYTVIGIHYIFRKPLKFKSQVWQPLEKKIKSIKYLQIDTTTRIIEQPNPERVEFWKKLMESNKLKK